MFHKHKWKEIARTYNTPLDVRSRNIAILAEVSYKAKEAIFGQTTILWECEICQKLRKEELLGKII